MFFEIKNETVHFHDGKTLSFGGIADSIGAKPDDVVYLGGSLVEGFVGPYARGMGNAFSDLDVFIIRNHNDFIDTEAEYSASAKKTYFRRLNEINMDIEVFDYDYVKELANILTNIKYEKGTRIFNVLGKSLGDGSNFTFANSFLNRLLYSVCVHNERLYREIKESIPYDKFFTLKEHAVLNAIDLKAEDVKGNLAAKEADAALYTFRDMARTVFEAVLAKEKVLVDRDKWVILKFVNFVKQTGKYNDLYEMHLNIFREGLPDDAVCLEKVGLALGFILKKLEDIMFGELEI